jgi:hypothetical protein
LEQRKLPSEYVARLVTELSDHLVDFLEDPMSTDAKDLHGVFQRLGEPAHVAARAAREHRQARFSRRHPVVMFVVLPILALPVLWFASLFAVVMLLSFLDLQWGSPAIGGPIWQRASACLPFVVVAILVLPASLTAAFFCAKARKAMVDWRWTLAACTLLAVISGLAAIEVMLPEGQFHGRILFGFSLKRYPSASQTLQFLLPLAICGWTIWRQVKDGVGAALHA